MLDANHSFRTLRKYCIVRGNPLSSSEVNQA